MHYLKHLIFYLSLVFNSIFCYPQFAIVKGNLNAPGRSGVSILKYSPIELEQNFVDFPAQNGRFEFRLELDKPEVSRIYNNYPLLIQDV